MSQYGYGGQNYGSHFGGKAGMYGQPHHGYGMNPQSSYEQHSSSPSNVSAFGQSGIHGRESTLASGLSDYSRTGAASQTSHTQAGAGGAASGVGSFGSMPDYLNTRSHSGNNQPYGGSHGHHHQQASDDPLKPFGDAKSAGGPNASALAQSGRPGSAAPNNSSAAQSGLQQHQQQQQQQHQQAQHQQAAQHQGQQSGYPSHLNHHHLQSSQYGSLGGLNAHQAGVQSHQGVGAGSSAGAGAGAGSGYGGYGNSFGGSYGNYGRGGGWGGSYGH